MSALKERWWSEAECRERSARFNDTTGAFGYWTESGPTGAYLHPDRCRCQGNDPTPHKHYPDRPYRCARCSKCRAYRPALAPRRGMNL